MDDKTETNLQVIAERINLLHGDVSDLKESLRDSMKEVAIAVTKLVQMEERSIHESKAVERAFDVCNKLREDQGKLFDRVVSLEREVPQNRDVSEGVKKAIWGILGVVGVYVAHKLGLI